MKNRERIPGENLPDGIILVFSGSLDVKGEQTVAANDTLARAKAAAAYIEGPGRGRVTCLCLTGGWFVAGQTESGAAVLFECIRAAMANPSLLNSFPVLLEKRSVDTFENVIFSVRDVWRETDLLYSRPDSLIVVSHPTHLRRIKLTLTKCIRDSSLIYELPVSYRLSFVQHLWELVFYLVHLFDPMGKGWAARRNRRQRNAAYRSGLQQ